jgi:hypothetical protein
MKKFFIIIGLLWITSVCGACPVCERNQPRVLRGITHGAGPQSRWDYLIVCAMLAVVVLTLFYSIKWLIRPGEREAGHIKYTILNSDIL